MSGMKGIMVVLGAVACFAGPLSSAAGAGTACDLFAMPSGSDAGTGTAIAPFRTAQELADALLPGQTGCLLPGVYRGDLRIDHGGSPGAPIRLIGDPARSATIVGRFYIPRGSDYVTVAGLRLDGINPAENLPSPTINADHATFAGDDVTNDRTAICFDV